jgi:hypothetical protein
MPAPDRGRREWVIGEDEVLDGVRYAAGSPLAMPRRQGVDPIGVG